MENNQNSQNKQQENVPPEAAPAAPQQQAVKRCCNPTCTTPAQGEPAIMGMCARCTAQFCNEACNVAGWSTHKLVCEGRNYITKVHLEPDHITDPPVVRTLSCPPHKSLHSLHYALQIAFGWSNLHTWDFVVEDPQYNGHNAVTPAASLSLAERQVRAMDGVLWGGIGNTSIPAQRKFVIRATEPFEGENAKDRRHPLTAEMYAQDMRVMDLVANPAYNGLKLKYTYDFGTKWPGWDHYITVLGRAPGTDDFVCLSGTGGPVAENTQPPSRWAFLKAADWPRPLTQQQAEDLSQILENTKRDGWSGQIGLLAPAPLVPAPAPLEGQTAEGAAETAEANAVAAVAARERERYQDVGAVPNGWPFGLSSSSGQGHLSSSGEVEGRRRVGFWDREQVNILLQLPATLLMTQVWASRLGAQGDDVPEDVLRSYAVGLLQGAQAPPMPMSEEEEVVEVVVGGEEEEEAEVVEVVDVVVGGEEEEGEE